MLLPNAILMSVAATASCPPIFSWLQGQGGVADAEMHRVFNCGIGRVVVVAEADADAALERLRGLGEAAFRLGRIEVRSAGQAQTVVR